MDNFKKHHAFYGKFIETREEVLYKELLDYVAYRNKSCQPSAMKLEQIATDDESTQSSCTSMVGLLMKTPARFVNIRKLLRLAATIPLTSCSAERCFSAMKILKSRLRLTMDDSSDQQLGSQQEKTGLRLVAFFYSCSFFVDNLQTKCCIM